MTGDIQECSQSRLSVYLVPATLVVFSILLPLLWLWPVLIRRNWLDGFWLAHSEAQSLATSGKFSGSYYATDAFSGELPVYYNMLSSTLMNVLAAVLGMPAIEVQAAVWGPLMVILLLVGSYLSVRLVTGDRIVALISALLISSMADGALVDWLYGWTSLGSARAKLTLHVPAVAQGLGTDQTFGWTLFLPCLAALYVALARRSAVLFGLAGALFAVLFKAHTLTLLNVATVATVYVFVHNVVVPLLSGDQSYALRWRFGAFCVAVAALMFHGATGTFGPGHFVALWAVSWGLALRDRTDIVNAITFAAGAAIVAGDYLWQLYVFRDSLAALEVKTSSLGIVVIAIFFLPFFSSLFLAGMTLAYKVATGSSTARKRGKSYRGLDLIVTAFVVMLVMSQGAYFGFNNHPYRSAINLIFPLAILTAMSIKYLTSVRDDHLALRAAILSIQVWLCLSVLKVMVALTGAAPAVAKALGATYAHNGFTVPDEGRKVILARIGEMTKDGKGKILLAPEYDYPKAAATAGALLSYSHIPAFLPDERYVLSKNQLGRRLSVFCSMFPDYPHRSPGRESGLCKPITSDDKPRLEISDPATLADIAPVYGLTIAADLDGKFAPMLIQRGEGIGWRPVIREGTSVIYEINPPAAATGRMAFALGRYSAPIWRIPFKAPVAGRYRIFAEGDGAAAAVRAVSIAGSPVAIERHGPDIVIVTADIVSEEGNLDIELAPDPELEHLPPVVFHFLSGLPANRAAGMAVNVK